MEKFLIRKAKVEDAYWIAFVHANTYYSTYKWLIPDEVLQARINSIDERASKTREFIKNGKPFLVVEDTENHEIIWMLSYSASRNEDYSDSGEIISIYLLPKYQKLGIGEDLFITWIRELINLWYNSMIVNVLKWNNAINFYQKYGGRLVWEKSDKFGDVVLSEYILFFDNIKSIK